MVLLWHHSEEQFPAPDGTFIFLGAAFKSIKLVIAYGFIQGEMSAVLEGHMEPKSITGLPKLALFRSSSIK